MNTKINKYVKQANDEAAYNADMSILLPVLKIAAFVSLFGIIAAFILA